MAFSTIETASHLVSSSYRPNLKSVPRKRKKYELERISFRNSHAHKSRDCYSLANYAVTRLLDRVLEKRSITSVESESYGQIRLKSQYGTM